MIFLHTFDKWRQTEEGFHQISITTHNNHVSQSHFRPWQVTTRHRLKLPYFHKKQLSIRRTLSYDHWIRKFTDLLGYQVYCRLFVAVHMSSQWDFTQYSGPWSNEEWESRITVVMACQAWYVSPRFYLGTNHSDGDISILI